MIARSLAEQSICWLLPCCKSLAAPNCASRTTYRKARCRSTALSHIASQAQISRNGRLLIHPEDRMWPPAELSVATPLGITLLGLSAGDRMPVVGGDFGSRHGSRCWRSAEQRQAESPVIQPARTTRAGERRWRNPGK